MCTWLGQENLEGRPDASKKNESKENTLRLFNVVLAFLMMLTAIAALCVLTCGVKVSKFW